MKFLLVAIVLGVAGCATPHQESWVKPGSDRQAFDADRYSCLKDAQIQPVYNPTMGRTDTLDNNLFSACMGAHGWEWK